MAWLFLALTLGGTLYLVLTGKPRARVGWYLGFCVILFGGSLTITAAPHSYGRTIVAVMVLALLGWIVLLRRLRRAR